MKLLRAREDSLPGETLAEAVERRRKLFDSAKAVVRCSICGDDKRAIRLWTREEEGSTDHLHQFEFSYSTNSFYQKANPYIINVPNTDRGTLDIFKDLKD